VYVDDAVAVGEGHMFLRNAWYVAAWDHEVTADALLGRILLDEPVVLYRTRDRRVVALEDRCCHRHYPLHKGTLTQDCIQCRYHGFTYDGSGRCVRVPGQSNVPEAARVKSYPVVERYRWVWVWMGDPARADESKIVDFHWLDHPEWRAKGTTFHVKSNYELILENLLDLTHLTFLHGGTIGTYATAENAEVSTRATDHDVTVTRWIIDSPAPGDLHQGSGLHLQHRSLAVHQFHATVLRPARHRWAGHRPEGARAEDRRLRCGRLAR